MFFLNLWKQKNSLKATWITVGQAASDKNYFFCCPTEQTNGHNWCVQFRSNMFEKHELRQISPDKITPSAMVIVFAATQLFLGERAMFRWSSRQMWLHVLRIHSTSRTDEKSHPNEIVRGIKVFFAQIHEGSFAVVSVSHWSQVGSLPFSQAFQAATILHDGWK